ncbi:MAG: L-rhamnose isomerase [Kiritimatiellaeota bacterium]|nr:L-rhamnose isomerase [Kiritimatiellota bacterium]
MKNYTDAKAVFAALGIDSDKAIKKALAVPLSIHCWQGDDVTGFENLGQGAPGGGLAVTGNHPGKARNPEELRNDIAMALDLMPGINRVSLHACYAEFAGSKVDRDAITVRHFQNWIDWAKQHNIGLDFNPTFFAHAKAADGCPLTSVKKGIRDFWIEHGKRTREIASAMGRQLDTSVLNNFWTPDGSKDTPADRLGPRKRLAESLDRIFAKPVNPKYTVESVESKLFGVGCESYTAGSNEFYMGYAVTRQKFICLDTGHFHPTEVVSDKLSAVAPFVPGIALHLSRGVRWDSDHVTALSDETVAIAQELVWNGLLPKTRIGLDYFDASINRIAAWAIGARNVRKSLLMAFLTPAALLRKAEQSQNLAERLALQEDFRLLPFGAVWHALCDRADAPQDIHWLKEIAQYAATVLSKRT